MIFFPTLLDKDTCTLKPFLKYVIQKEKKKKRDRWKGVVRERVGGEGGKGRGEVSHKRSRTCNNSIYQKEIELQMQCGKIA